MLTNLVKLTAVTFLWKKYKSTIVSTLVLIIYFSVVAVVHQDYLAYKELEGSSENLGLSFVLKWLAWLGGIVFYFLFDSIGSNNKLSGDKLQSGKDRRNSKSSNDNKKSNKNNSNEDKKGTPAIDTDNQQDPFSAIREKKKLRSKADLLIEKNK